MDDETTTPAEPATELGVSAKRVRDILRARWGTLARRGDRWHLTPAQADIVRAHFTKAS